MKNYQTLLQNALKELTHHPNVELMAKMEVDWAPLNPTNLAFFDYKLEKNLGYTFSKEQASYFNFLNFVQIYWSYTIDGKMQAVGDFKLENAYRCLAKSKAHPIWNDSTSEEEIALLYLMDLNYEGMLTALILTRGIGNWEYFFCNLDGMKDNRKKYIINQLEQDLTSLKALFPATDYHFYENRLAQLLITS